MQKLSAKLSNGDQRHLRKKDGQGDCFVRLPYIHPCLQLAGSKTYSLLNTCALLTYMHKPRDQAAL